MYENDKVRELCGIYDDIVQSVKGELAKGIETVDTHELGEAIDMIKDLAEAKKKTVGRPAIMRGLSRRWTISRKKTNTDGVDITGDRLESLIHMTTKII